MNKKLIIVLTMILVFTLTAPVMAQPFQDVSQNHWAHDSLRQVAKAGLIQGYSDGEFKGNESLSRYEVAALTSKVLDKIKAEDTELSQDVANALQQLAGEFDKELAAVNDELDAMQTVKITGKTGVEYKDITVGGEGTTYQDPYEQDIDGDGDIDDDDKVVAEDNFKQTIDSEIKIAKDGVTADLNLQAVNNYFGNKADESNFTVESLSGTVTTEQFKAAIGDDQDLGWKDYLFGGEDNIDGVILNAGNSTVALGRADKDEDNIDTKTLAVKQENLLALPVDVFMGLADEEGTDAVVGAEGAFQLAGVDLTGEVAVNDTDLEEKLARLGVSKKIAKVNLAADYQYATDGFTAIQPDDYEGGNETTLSAEVEEENPYVLVGVNVFGNLEYEVNSEDQARYLEANKELGDVKLAALYDYEKTNDGDDTNDKSDKVVSVAYAPEFEVAGIQLAPEAKLAAVYDLDNEQYLNQEAAVDAVYKLGEKTTLTGGYSWANKEARVDTAGQKAVAKAGVEYQVTEGSAATLDYKQMDFTGEEETDSYNTESIVGKYSIQF